MNLEQRLRVEVIRQELLRVTFGHEGLRSYLRGDIVGGSIVRETRYRQTGNPAFVWQELACSSGAALPEWVLKYLRRAALLMLAEGLEQPSKPIAESVAEALGFKSVGFKRRKKSGAGNPLRTADAQTFSMAKALALRLAAGEKLYLAREALACECAVSERTVRRAWSVWAWYFGFALDTKLTTSRHTTP